MASSKKPKGIEEDLARKILALIRKGTPAAKKKAKELQGIQRAYRDDAAKMRSNNAALGREYDRKLGAEYYASKRASEAKSVSQRLREESALRGMDSKFKKVAARDRADETKAATAAGIRAERRKATKQAGGRNAPDRIDARKRAAANRAKNAKPKKPRNNKK